MANRKYVSKSVAGDDPSSFVIHRDLGGGMNTRQHEQIIDKNQAVLLENILLETSGSRTIRQGCTRCDDTYPSSEAGGDGLFGFDPDGGTFELLAMQNGKLSGWLGYGTFSDYKTDFTPGISTIMVKAGQQGQGDVCVISNGTDNPFVMYQDHTMHDLGSSAYYSMPKTKVVSYYGNRLWALKENQLSFSDAYPTSYAPDSASITGDATTFTGVANDKIKVTIDTSGGATYKLADDIDVSACTDIDGVVSAINTAVGYTVADKSSGKLRITSTIVGAPSHVAIADGTTTGTTCIARLFSVVADRSDDGLSPWDNVSNIFRMPVGTEKALIATRDQGIICMGADQIWGIAPSTVPSPTTDFPKKILDMGCMNGRTAVQCADDVVFLAPDGVRGLFRTQLDKLQAGQSFPLSWTLQDEFNEINWSAIDKACAVFFENKYIIALPTGVSTTNNKVWVYYPALSSSYSGSTNPAAIATSKSWVIYTGWNISSFAKLRINGQEQLYGIDSTAGKVYHLFNNDTDDGNAIIFDEISRAEDFDNPLAYKMGAEFKIRARGSNGTLVISADADGKGFVQLGTLDLLLGGVTFPTTFPVDFTDNDEIYQTYHLDDAGIIKFKRVKFEIYCDTPGASITILESTCTAFVEEYLSED